MFAHLFIYRIKSLLRMRVVVFWSFVYPIALALLFYVTFGSGIGKETGFAPINVCVVKENVSESLESFTSVMEEIEYNENMKMFIVNDTDKENAKKLLSEGKAEGIVYLSDDIEVEVSASGMNQSILKIFTDSYKRNVLVLTDAYLEGPEKVEAVSKVLEETNHSFRKVSLAGAKADSYIQYFYSIIAMACLFGSFVGIQMGNELQANASALAARKCVSSVHRLSVICADMCAAFLIDFLEVLLVGAFLEIVLKIHVCSQVLPFLLICFCGSMIGVATGQFVTFIARGKQGLQIAISLSFSLTSCFLGGLMSKGMDHLVAMKMPIVASLNPASLITNSLYCLAVYEDYRRVSFAMITLAAEALLLTFISYLASRRTRHASI